METEEATCPSCGAPLSFPIFSDWTRCNYCGNEVTLRRPESLSFPELGIPTEETTEETSFVERLGKSVIGLGIGCLTYVIVSTFISIFTMLIVFAGFPIDWFIPLSPLIAWGAGLLAYKYYTKPNAQIWDPVKGFLRQITGTETTKEN